MKGTYYRVAEQVAVWAEGSTGEQVEGRRGGEDPRESRGGGQSWRDSALAVRGAGAEPRSLLHPQETLCSPPPCTT